MKDIVDAFPFIGHHVSLLLHKAGEQLALSAEALIVAILIGLPLGVWLGHLHRGSFAAISISNVGRALPSLAVIAILIVITGHLGNFNVGVALVILAFPILLTNAYVAIDGVEDDVVDAARGMGLTGWQILRDVELPLALPLIAAGVRTAAVYSVATATLAGVTGGDGTFGEIIANPASYRLSGVVGAAICTAALALLVDGAFALAQRAITPRGLRTLDRAQAVTAVEPAAARS